MASSSTQNTRSANPGDKCQCCGKPLKGKVVMLEQAMSGRRLHIFSVTGKGRFPLDMLRYDQCWPRAAEDAEAIGMNLSSLNPREVTSVILLVAWAHGPTIDRWRSFGWEAKIIRTTAI